MNRKSTIVQISIRILCVDREARTSASFQLQITHVAQRKVDQSRVAVGARILVQIVAIVGNKIVKRVVVGRRGEINNMKVIKCNGSKAAVDNDAVEQIVIAGIGNIARQAVSPVGETNHGVFNVNVFVNVVMCAICQIDSGIINIVLINIYKKKKKN